MATLLRKSDKDIMKDINYTKNATFYKDMLAFYDAYLQIINRQIYELPNYLFLKNQLVLDGICMLIKDCAFEFKFETLNPSLDYLKIIYFSIAEYSDNGELPEREIIENEFDEYRNNLTGLIERSKEIYKNNEEKCNEFSKINEEQKAKYLKLENKVKSKSKLNITLSIVFSILFIASVLGVALISTVRVLFIILCLGLIAGYASLLVINLKNINKLKEKLKYEKNEYDSTEYENKSNLKNLNDDRQILNRILSEEYDSRSLLAEEVFNKSKHNIDKLLDKMAEREILSYNLKYDIMMISKTQDKEILDIIDSLDQKNCNFNKIYNKIIEKNWIFYNPYIRYKFISRFFSSAIRSHKWKVIVDKQKRNPFDIDIKLLANERVSILKEDENKIYCFPLEYVIKSDLLNKFNIKKFEMIEDVEELRKLKNEYSKKFFDAKKLTDSKDAFFDLMLGKKDDKLNINSIQEFSKMPLLFEIEEKIKLIEFGYDNSNKESILKTIEQIIEKIKNQNYDDMDDIFSFTITYEDVYDAIEDQFDEVVDIDDNSVRYSYAGSTFIGFKIDLK